MQILKLLFYIVLFFNFTNLTAQHTNIYLTTNLKGEVFANHSVKIETIKKDIIHKTLYSINDNSVVLFNIKDKKVNFDTLKIDQINTITFIKNNFGSGKILRNVIMSFLSTSLLSTLPRNANNFNIIENKTLSIAFITLNVGVLIASLIINKKRKVKAIISGNKDTFLAFKKEVDQKISLNQ